jgi:alanine racemase
MPRPLQATIHLDSMQHNLARARACAPMSKLWAVVKANAYGHGLERGMRGFVLADGLALIETENALRLRELGWIKPILLLEGIFDASDVPLLAEHNINSTVHCIEQIKMLEYTQLYRPIDVHLKMNTGMNRLGFNPQDYRPPTKRLRAIPGIRNITLMTHFANSDELEHPRLSIAEQVRRFRLGAQGLRASAACRTRAACCTRPNCAGTAQRLGPPRHHALRRHPGRRRPAKDYGLLPTMTLKSEIIGIQHLQVGDTRRLRQPLRGRAADARWAWSPAAMPTATRATPSTAPRCWSTACAPRWSGASRWT